MGGHLGGGEHVLDDLVHVGRQPLGLQLQHLHQPCADRLAHFRGRVVRQGEQPLQVPGQRHRR